MKELVLEQQGKQYIVKDQGTIIYTGQLHHNGSVYELVLHNAFGEEILAISYTKGGFHLFRSPKLSHLEVRQYGRKGTLTPQERTYRWDLQGVSYTFVCGEQPGHMDVIMRDQNETLGYVEDHTLCIANLMYSAELCAVWMVMQERKDLKERVFMEPEKFARAMKDARER